MWTPTRLIRGFLQPIPELLPKQSSNVAQSRIGQFDQESPWLLDSISSFLCCVGFLFKRHAAFLRIRVWRRGKTREGKDIRL